MSHPTQLGKAQRGSRWIDPEGSTWFWDNGWHFTVGPKSALAYWPEKIGQTYRHNSEDGRGPVRLNPGQFFTELAGGSP